MTVTIQTKIRPSNKLDNPQAVTVNKIEIVIDVRFINKDHAVPHREFIVDIFANRYHGQKIRIETFDGENLEFSGFMNFVDYLVEIFNIPTTDVTIFTHQINLSSKYKVEPLLLGIFEQTNNYLNSLSDYQLDNPKFVGTCLGRFNPTRVRLVYELDKHFIDDSFVIFQSKIQQLPQAQDFREIYAKEFAHIESRQFDQDVEITNPTGAIGNWRSQSLMTYKNIWSKFQIEIVSETDAFSNWWFTEKTARCLATGKPFLLLAGTGSLAYLRKMGFETYNSIIDESYDLAKTPTERINKIVECLVTLYQSADKDQRIQDLNKIAQRNIEAYQTYIYYANRGIIRHAD